MRMSFDADTPLHEVFGRWLGRKKRGHKHGRAPGYNHKAGPGKTNEARIRKGQQKAAANLKRKRAYSAAVSAYFRGETDHLIVPR